MAQEKHQLWELAEIQDFFIIYFQDSASSQSWFYSGGGFILVVT